MRAYPYLAILAVAATAHANKHVVKNPAASTAPQVVIVMLVDDLGYGDFSYTRNTSMNSTYNEHYTPNIDNLAHSGIILNNFYAHFFCTPSRSSILSGRLPVHVQQGQAFPETPSAGIPRNMTTLGTKMQQAGYKTHAVGKWDVGMATPTHTPEGRGFDSSLIYFEHLNDYWTQKTNSGGTACNWLDPNITDLWDTGKPASTLNGTKYIEYLLEDRVLDIISTHDPSDKLFIYYAPHTAHYPLEVPQEWYDKYNYVTNDEAVCQSSTPVIWPGSNSSDYSCRRQHDAMVGLLDAIIGNITSALKSTGLWDQTMIVFATDNGAPLDLDEGAGSNTPLRGGKYSSWQGGIRVPAFVSGGYVPQQLQGTQQDAIVHIADWYGTLCAMNGVDSYDPVAAAAGLPPVDSVNVWPVLSGRNSTWPRTEIPVSPQTLIQWPWKLVTGVNIFATWQGQVYPNASSSTASSEISENCGNGCLYNLIDDPTEHNDVSAQQPAIVSSMNARLNELIPSFFNNNDTGVDACPKNITILCGCWMAINHWGSFLGPYQI